MKKLYQEPEVKYIALVSEEPVAAEVNQIADDILNPDLGDVSSPF